MNNDITPAPQEPVPSRVKIDRHPRPDEDKNNSRSGWRSFLSTFGILAMAFGVALLLVSFVFRSYQVDGSSMQNTLQNDDKLIIWKVPRTLSSITGHPYIPARGDIIIFTQSNLNACNQNGPKQLVKRVIGLPGDRVVVGNGVYTVYNKQYPKGFDPDKTLPYFNFGKTLPVTTGDASVTLKADQIFVSGDNRPGSCDSRAFGPIAADQVIGKLVLRVFPVNTIRLF